MRLAEDQLQKARAEDVEEAVQVSELHEALCNVRTENNTLQQSDLECQLHLKMLRDELADVRSTEDQLHRSRAAELEHGRSEAAQVSELQDLLSTVRTEHETLQQADIECQLHLKMLQAELTDVLSTEDQLHRSR